MSKISLSLSIPSFGILKRRSPKGPPVELLASLGNMVGYYSAFNMDENVQLDGSGNILHIEDLSGNGNHLKWNYDGSPGTTQRLQYKPSGGPGGTGAFHLRMSGVARSDNAMLTSKSMTIVCRAARFSSDIFQCYIQAPRAISTSLSLPTQNSIWYYIRWWNDMNFKGGRYAASFAKTHWSFSRPSAWHTYAMRISSNGVINSFVDGEYQSEGNSGYTWQSDLKFCIGATNSTGGTDVEMTDAIAYDSYVSNENMMELHNAISA